MKLKFKQKDNYTTVLKKGAQTVGFVEKLKDGYGYGFGKPSDNCPMLTGKSKPLTFDEAKEKLLENEKACPL